FVDDDPAILTALGRIVRTRNWPSHACTGPEEALKFLKKRRDIGVVVSDQSMPGMSGVDFLARVREMRPLVQRVLLTGHADASVLASAINSGAVLRYVAKPWNNADLLQAVEAAVDQAELLRENRRLRLLTRRK